MATPYSVVYITVPDRKTADTLGEKLVGFTSCIQWGQRLEGHYLGLDYEHNVPNGVYQNILYDDVREAIRRGCGELLVGP